MSNSNVNELKKRLRDDDKIYLLFGKSLEPEHNGEFVAISRKGEIIISVNDIEVLQKALKKFGSGNFVFRRIGHEAIGKWRILIAH